MRVIVSKTESDSVAHNPLIFSPAPTSYTLANSRRRKNLARLVANLKFRGGIALLFLTFGGAFLDADRGSFLKAD
jgi:hypothetical protein